MESVDLGLMLGINIIALIGLVFFGAIVGDEQYSSRSLGAWFAFCWGLGLSVFGWGVFVIVHFLSKYW